jgi:hypothetical protein
MEPIQDDIAMTPEQLAEAASVRAKGPRPNIETTVGEPAGEMTEFTKAIEHLPASHRSDLKGVMPRT